MQAKLNNQIPMIPVPAFEELTIVVAANNNNPATFTPDFLKYSGIISTDWELAEPALLNSHLAQITFTNGINLSAQFDNITFSESLEAKALEDVKIPAIARKYIETLPNTDYQGVEINPSSFFTFEDEDEGGVRNYIVTTLLSPGAWHEFGSKPVTATLQLAYTLKQRQFNLKIDDVRLRRPDNTPQSAVLFSGNFPYKITGDTTLERLQHLYGLIDNWQGDLKTYRELVNQRFLGISA